MLMGRKVSELVVICVILIVSATAVSAEDGDVGLDSDSIAHPYVPGEVLVKFKPGVALKAVAEASARFKAEVKGEIPEIGVRVLKVPPSEMAATIAAYKGDPRVEYVEPDYIAEVTYEPDDPYYRYGYQWGLKRIEAPSAWDISPGSPEVIVAVVDSGVAPNHPDLEGKLVPGYNFVARSEDTSDDLGHGTHVAGIIAAGTDNGMGVAGVSFNSRIMPVKVVDSRGYAKYSDVAKGIIYAADHGAKVINLSLGGYAPSSYLQDAVSYAWSKGAVVVAAAGNGNSDKPFYPAACTDAIAVSATDRGDARASFSNYGSYISVAAPGVGIYSTYRRRGSNYYASMSGTSAAAAHVSGVAALLFSQDVTRPNIAVRELIEGEADDLGDPGWDRYYGHGRVNAFRALKAAESTPSPGLSYGISINDGALYVNTPEVELSLTAPPQTTKVQVSNSGDFDGASWQDYTSPIPWTLDGNSPGLKTVYARFMDEEGTVSNVYADDIILDFEPPVGAVRVDSQQGSTVVLSLPATDDISGVHQMQVSQDPSFADAEWIPYHPSHQYLGDGSDPFHARYKDRAGNVSQTYSTATSSKLFKIYLPLTAKSGG